MLKKVVTIVGTKEIAGAIVIHPSFRSDTFPEMGKTIQEQIPMCNGLRWITMRVQTIGVGNGNTPVISSSS